MSFKSLMDSFKRDTVVLGAVQRHLLAQQRAENERRQDVLHPSELCKDDVCDRALYYRLAGWEIPVDEHAFQLETIFEQGHEYHAKWQNWNWSIGLLRGRFRCLSCGKGDWNLPGGGADLWITTSPSTCPGCGSPRRFLEYGEVPISLPEYRILGHADGDLDIDPEDGPANEDDPLLEIKSIGAGTVRFEAPKLIARHTKKVTIDDEEKSWTDWDKLWRDIRRPFPTHVRQATLYCLAKQRRQMVFIYESKFNGGSKEFTVKADPEVVEDILEMCLDIDYALKKGVPPKCRHGGCKACESYEKLRAGASDETQDQSSDREDSDAGAGEGTSSEEGAADTREAPRRVPRARARRRVQRLERPRADRRDDDVHSLGGLLERATRSGGDHRGDGGQDPPSNSRREDARSGRTQGEGDRGESRGRVVRRSRRS